MYSTSKNSTHEHAVSTFTYATSYRNGKMYYQNKVSLQMTRLRNGRSRDRVYSPAEISFFFKTSRPDVCPSPSPAQTVGKEFLWWQITPGVKLNIQLHVVLNIRMSQATVRTLPCAFRVWGLMNLENTLISLPFLKEPEPNQDPFFARGGMMEIMRNFSSHTYTIC